MSTLLLRFAAPLQSWGNDSKYDCRRTQREPTKSGIIGFLASALGRKRDADLSDLSCLHIAVRTDRQGQLIRDFHIVRKMKGDKLVASYVTKRYYLSDAVFLVGIESDDVEKLKELQEAILHPEHPLFLGRRSCPPTGKVCLGVFNENLANIISHYPLLVNRTTASFPLQVMIDTDNVMEGSPVADQPISFSPYQRQFAYRLAVKYYLNEQVNEEHDPMKELR